MTSTSTGTNRAPTTASFISRVPIFLPRYSGVRPTISPARNTAMTTSSRTPNRPDPGPPEDHLAGHDVQHDVEHEPAREAEGEQRARICLPVLFLVWRD